ncbi:MAG: cell division protein ZapA [Proteobacteria bacterium]|nr:cell division protein ZapA [Pseudomonadota bacterium]
MSMSLDITLLGKDYRVACAPEEREALLAAVDMLDARIRDIGARTRSSGERLAVMTALNLAHELLALREPGTYPPPAPLPPIDDESSRRRIEAIEARLDQVLAGHKQDDLF